MGCKVQKFLKVIIVVFTIAIIVFFIKDSYLATNSKDEYNSLHPAVLIFFALYLYTIVKYYNLSIKENSKKLQELNKQLVARNNLLQLNNEALKVLLEIRKMISISQNVKVTLEKISQSCNEKLNFKTGVFMLSADKKTLDLIISPCFCSDEKNRSRFPMMRILNTGRYSSPEKTYISHNLIVPVLILRQTMNWKSYPAI